MVTIALKHNVRKIFHVLFALLLVSSFFYISSKGERYSKPVLAYSSAEFVTVWKTDNTGSSNSTSITIPTTGTGYNYDVD